jgi:hypothetical protein
MARTNKHKEEAKFKNYLISSENGSLNLSKKLDREDNNFSESIRRKNSLKNKISKKELREMIEESDDCDDPTQDEIIGQIFGRNSD